MESKEKGSFAGLEEALDPIVAPLALAFKRMIHTVERETGIAGMKWFLLKMLDRSDGISQGEVSQEYEMDPSRVTRTVQAMERDGMILRERDPEDNRVVRLYLTDEGRELLAKSPQVNEELHRRIREVMSEEEFEELRRMLVLLAGTMKE